MPDIQLWPDWKIVREIGSGSYGKVYEIHRQNGVYLERAALKVIRIPQNKSDLEQLCMDGIQPEATEAYLERHVEEIRNEIGLMQRLIGHSNIVSYEDYLIKKHTGDVGWDILIRMELLTALPVYLSSHKLSQQEVIRLGLDISRALMICHEAGIIHRDIKPQNIFRNDRGDYKLGDFGVSRVLPGSGSILSFKGTLSYMAPETFAMQSTDARSDLYSLALVLYRILNGGRVPFLDSTGFTPAQQEAAQRRRMAGEPIPNPERGSPSLCRVLSIALSANPEARYQTAEQFHRALKNVAEEDREVQAGTILLNDNIRQIKPYMTGQGEMSRRTSVHVADPSDATLYGGNTGKGFYYSDHPNREMKVPISTQTAQLPDTGRQVNRGLGYSNRIKHGNKEHREYYERLRKASMIVLISAAALLFMFACLFLIRWNTSSNASKQVTSIRDNSQKSNTEPWENEDIGSSDTPGELQAHGELDQEYVNGGISDSEAMGIIEAQSLEKTWGSGSEENSGGNSGKTLTLQEAVEAADYVVQFEDSALEKAVRNYLHISDRKITKEEALEQKTLVLSGKNWSNSDKITDLTGLSAFANLEELDVSENLITDLTELSGMSELEILHLEGNSIHDLFPLNGLSNLKRLDLERNTVADISSLADLNNLEMLDIRGNRIDNISALSFLRSMKELYLSDNQISDISAVSEMPSLWYLSMNNNPVEDLSPVDGREKLTTLCLSGTDVKDIQVVMDLPLLSYLDVRDCRMIIDRTPLEHLKKRGGVTVKE